MATYQDFLYSTMKGFKNSWKKLYEDYLEIIRQGSMLERIC